MRLVARAQAATPKPAQKVEPVTGPVPDLPDGSPFRQIVDGRVRVDTGETLGHFSEWLGVPVSRLRRLNKLSQRASIHMGQWLELDFSRVSAEAFAERRTEYHKGVEEDFFGSYKVTGTVEHRLARGESLWILSHRIYAVPTWLIQRYNPDVDLTRLAPGTRLQIPVIEGLGG